MFDKAVKRPIKELYELGLQRLEYLLEGEPVYYDSEDDIAAIVGIVIALANAKTQYYFYWYKETEGDAFKDYLSKQVELAGVIDRLKSIRGRNLYVINDTDILTIPQRAKRVKDPYILDRKTRILYWDARMDPLKYFEFYAVNRRWGLSYILENRFVQARGPYYGYWIVHRKVAAALLKKAFEERLHNMFKLFNTYAREKGIVLTKEGEEIIERIESMVVAKSKTNISLENISGEKLYERVDLRPPCMQILLIRLKETGHLKHAERFQLGTFLKRLGMDVETQKRFRYEHAVDNLNISREEFEKRGGYQIEHIYGIRGSKKDYNVPSCRSARFGDYYCPFAKEDPSALAEYLVKLKIPGEEIEKIVDIVRNGREAAYVEACKRYFEAKIGKKVKTARRNPLGYTLRAARLMGLLKSKEKHEGSSEGS